MSAGLRRHHYLFAHRALPSTVFQYGADLVAAGRDGDLALDDVWHRVGQTLPDQERLPADGLAVSHHHIDEHDVLLVTFPPAVHPPEAHYAAIALSTRDGRVRYITLEDARSPIDGSGYTVLGEWTDDGDHVNRGCGPKPGPDAFLGALGSVLTQQAGP